MQSGLRDTQFEAHEASILSREIDQHPLGGLSTACRLFPGLERDFPASFRPVSSGLHASLRASESHTPSARPCLSHTPSARGPIWGPTPLCGALAEGSKASCRAPSAPCRLQGAVSTLPLAGGRQRPAAFHQCSGWSGPGVTASRPRPLGPAHVPLAGTTATTPHTRNVPSPCSCTPVPIPPPRRCAATTSASAACERRPFFFYSGHFRAVAGLASHHVYTESGSHLATYPSLWLRFCGTAEPTTPYGSFRTQPGPATWLPPPLFFVRRPPRRRHA